jgi:type II secretory pathway pseudopilin PulG
MRRVHTETGFTIAEFLVAITLFSLLAFSLTWALMNTIRSSDTARNVIRVSEEARLGFNRMVRDSREGSVLVSALPASYEIKTDFNDDGLYQNPNANGDYEDLTFAHDNAAHTVTLNGSVLVRGVYCIGNDCTANPIFTYTSNRLEYDGADGSSPNGVVTWQELDAAPGTVGNGNGILDGGEMPFLSSIEYGLQVRSGNRNQNFYGEAQLRNRR